MSDNTKSRLIEHAFPLEQASLDSVHEKNVRHGHISTLHIWPARRPLAACRAALIATLLPDPGTPAKRKELVEKIGGIVDEKTEKKKMPNGQVVDRVKRFTKGGILHWGLETENKSDLEWFRQEIRKAYGGRAPKFLDPFAGGGAIPLEAMRLGCETTAIDINPVAWFILKCTLEYPQRLAGQKRPLPSFVLKDRDFMEAFLKVQGFKGATLKTQLKALGLGEDNAPHLDGMGPDAPTLEADLAWHIRAWGKWVFNHVRQDLAKYYPVYADFVHLKPGGKHYKTRNPTLAPLKADGTYDTDDLNAEFAESKDYLDDPTHPRWVAKQPVAYLWARTVACKNCRSTVPILKTRWLCRKDKKRILLHIKKATTEAGVLFELEHNVPLKGGNAAQRREHDRKLGQGTMSKSGAQCPFCPATMTREDLQLEGKGGNLGYAMTAVVVDGLQTKEYRLPEENERLCAVRSSEDVERVFAQLPGGIPTEPIQTNAKGDTWCVNYGIDQFHKLFTPRQLLSLGTFAASIRQASARLRQANYEPDFSEAITGYLYCSLARLADRNSQACTWQVGADKIGHTFTRYALPFTWDFVEVMPWADSSGGFLQAVDWVAQVAEHTSKAGANSPFAATHCDSAIRQSIGQIDLIITDPPYYDAIGYGVVMDFFAVWLRRCLSGVVPGVDNVLTALDQPKWDHKNNDGELVDDATRHGGDKTKSKSVYEDGMAKAFAAAHKSLSPDGRLVVVFAHKEPDAWETLVSAMIRSGFVVDASWPIMTERSSRMRSMGSAALSSSVWLVCRKRPIPARPGWDNKVLEEMRESIREQLRAFWDAGIRGPDFVWAATGPALESYSKYPAVKKARDPGKLMDVSEFLRQVRRIVVDFVVGRVLTPDKDPTEATGLDDVTTYYLLHRHDFGMSDAPAGPCILYAVSCNLSDTALADQYDILARTGGTETEDEQEETEEPETDTEVEEGSGSKLRLKNWNQRTNPMMGYDPSVDSTRARSDAMQMKFLEENKEPPRRRQIPLIDQAHRLMHLWRAGDVAKVDDYLEVRALVRHKTFLKLLQALIELAPQGSDERSLLEKISNYIAARGGTDQMVFDVENGTDKC